jgi:hypothetical protein
VVLADILGVVYELVVANAVPPVATLNQAMVAPEGGVAVSMTVPVPHLALPEPVGAEGGVFMVAVAATLDEATHPVVRFLVSA